VKIKATGDSKLNDLNKLGALTDFTLPDQRGENEQKGNKKMQSRKWTT